MDELERSGIPYEVCPGVSSFCGAAAALGAEYTLPGISQSVVITRMAGRTPVPDKESIRSFAAHQATMVVFLSTGMLEKLSEELIRGGYPADTPAAVVYKATWPEEKVLRCTVADLAQTAREEGVTKTALIVVGRVLDGEYERSKALRSFLYNGVQESICSRRRSIRRDRGEKSRGAGTMSKIYVTGLGPGAADQMTKKAEKVLEHCPVIIGYTVYIDLIGISSRTKYF